MTSVFTSSITNALKETLELIIDDPTDGYDQRALFHQWMDERPMSDNWEDDQEYGGPGLATEKPEGQEMSTGSIYQGYTTRYIARTFALKLIITEEALEDNKYDKVIRAAGRLKRALWKTADIDATQVLVRAWNTSYVGGDAQPLFSASHTLPQGGTFSNTMAVPLGPSVTAVQVATSSMRKLPGHDGITEGVEPRMILCPTEQWAVWDEILKSKFVPESGNFARVNVANMSLNLSALPIKYWSNTTTNYCFLTDCDYGLQFRWRRKPRSRTWVDNDQELMKYGISARWARGWSDPRCAYGVQA